MKEQLEHKLDAQGTVYVILSVDMSRFVANESRDAFQRLLGRRAFDTTLRELKLKGDLFIKDEEAKKIEERSLELGLFKSIFREEVFPQTHILVKERVSFDNKLEENVQFKALFLAAWKLWNFRVRLSKNGVLTVVMHREIKQWRRLIDISKDVLGLQLNFDLDSAKAKLEELNREFSDDADIRRKIESIAEFNKWINENTLDWKERPKHPVQWFLATEVIRHFIEACGYALRVKDGENDVIIKLGVAPSVEEHALYEKYVVYHFTGLSYFEKKRRMSISPSQALSATDFSDGLDEETKTTLKAMPKAITGLLEGVVVGHTIKGSSNSNKIYAYDYPDHDEDYTSRVIEADNSSWRDEFCIITGESAIIYHLPQERDHVSFPAQEMPYEYYWRCIIRGMEFVLELKVFARLIERLAGRCLTDGVPLVRLPKPSVKDHQELVRITQSAANAARLLAVLRSLSAPEVFSEASYGVVKFRSLIEHHGVQHVLNHAEQSLDDLNNLLNHHENMRTQEAAHRTSEISLALSALFAGFSLGLSILVFPSFVSDTLAWQKIQALSQAAAVFLYLGPIVLTTIILISVGTILYSCWRLWELRQRR